MVVAPAPRLLVLWDVDHTLIETRGVGRVIYERAFPVATGKPVAELAAISGRTELDIMSESLRINGVEPSEAMVRKLMDALVQGYEQAREELRTTGRALPDAEDTLSALVKEPAVYQSVLTGNLYDVARIKLEVFGLERLLDLETGAYGDDACERSDLVRIAQGRAMERTGTTFDNGSTVLVGDTPNDVHAALTAGVRVIAVATGKTNADVLRAAGAQHTAADLGECLGMLRRFIAESAH